MLFLRHRCWRLLTSLLILFVVFALLSLPAIADGGAPQLAYVSGSAPGISVIDIARRSVTRTITPGGNPGTILLNPDGHALYVSQPASDTVTALAAATGKAVCSAHVPGQPSLLALSLDATMLYAAGQDGSQVYAIDPTSCAITRTFDAHEPVQGIAIAASVAADATPSTPNQLWIAGTTSLTVYEVNGHLLGSIPIADGPQHLTIPGGFTAYVTTRQGTVVAVDLNTRRVIGTILTGGRFGTMDYDATTGEVYVPDMAHNRLDVLTPVIANATVKPQEPVRVIHVSGTPESVAITVDGQLGFVALRDAQVLMLDIPGRRVITSIAVGGSPHFIITGLYPPTGSSPPAQQTSSLTGSFSRLFPVIVLVVVIVVVSILALTLIFWSRSRKQAKSSDGSSL